MRMGLNQLQYMSLSMSTIKYKDIRQRLLSSSKDEDVSPFAAVDKLFGYNAANTNIKEYMEHSSAGGSGTYRSKGYSPTKSSKHVGRTHLKFWVRKEPPKGQAQPDVAEDGAPEEKYDISVMTFNICGVGRVPFTDRVDHILHLIGQLFPDIICLQEVTAEAYCFLSASWWWSQYKLHLDYHIIHTQNKYCMILTKIDALVTTRDHLTIHGREFVEFNCVDIRVQGRLLRVGTRHIKAGCLDSGRSYVELRTRQLALIHGWLLEGPHKDQSVDWAPADDLILLGDFNWDNELNGEMPLEQRWHDVWMMLRPQERGDTWGQALPSWATGQKRFDRVLSTVRTITPTTIDLHGT